MTEQKKVATTEAAPVHANVHVALGAAQAEMGALLKGEVNPHFKSKYASLADVVAACREPFTRNGLCFYHETVKDDMGWLMRTVLCHGTSGTSLHCDVPLIVQKNDMQGFKSATTYAKRVGLESVSGLAPEDDDGNAAAKAAPPENITEEQFRELSDLIEQSGVDMNVVLQAEKIRALHFLAADRFGSVQKRLLRTIEARGVKEPV